MRQETIALSELNEIERIGMRAMLRGIARFTAWLVAGVFFVLIGLGIIAIYWELYRTDSPSWYYPLLASLVLVLVTVCVVLVRHLMRIIFQTFKQVNSMPAGMLTASQASELTESRREIVAAFEIERRRIERDLHDGAQQFLVTASMDIGEASLLLETAMAGGEVDAAQLGQVGKLLTKAQDDAEAALKALRSTVAGIHPKVLSDLGLEAAVESLCSSSPLDIVLRVPMPLPVLPEGVVAAGYFLVSEALTNVAKYAPGARVSVLLVADDDLHISVTDEGPGGATIRPDGGLSGLRERLASFGGKLSLISPPGGPTTVSAYIPLLLRQGEFGVSPQANVLTSG